MSDSVEAVVAALGVLYDNPDPAAKDKANAWLQQFQKSVSNTRRLHTMLFDRFRTDTAAYSL